MYTYAFFKKILAIIVIGSLELPGIFGDLSSSSIASAPTRLAQRSVHFYDTLANRPFGHRASKNSSSWKIIRSLKPMDRETMKKGFSHAYDLSLSGFFLVGVSTLAIAVWQKKVFILLSLSSIYPILPPVLILVVFSIYNLLIGNLEIPYKKLVALYGTILRDTIFLFPFIFFLFQGAVAMHEAFHLLVLKLLFVNSHLASIILEDGGGSTGGIGVNLRQLKPWAIKQGISLNAATLILQLAGFWGAFIFSAGSIRIAQLVESRKIRFKNHIQRALVIAAVSSLIISSLYASITEKGSDMYYVELIGVILKMEWLVLSFQSSCWIMAMWGFVQYYKMDQWFSSRHLYRQFISSRA